MSFFNILDRAEQVIGVLNAVRHLAQGIYEELNSSELPAEQAAKAKALLNEIEAALGPVGIDYAEQRELDKATDKSQ